MTNQGECQLRLIPSPVLDRASTVFDATPIEPLTVKGKSEPLAAYEVGAETGSRTVERTGELTFVGRADELQVVETALRRSGSGAEPALVVVGASGTGKTRLVHEAVEAVAADEATEPIEAFVVQGEPYAVAVAYRALRYPLRRLLGIVPVHRLEVVGSQHEDHQGERRMHLDPLRQASQAVAAGLERIVPHRTPTVEAVLDHPHRFAAGIERAFHHAGPPRVERQSAPRLGNDAPGQRVGVNEDLVHRVARARGQFGRSRRSNVRSGNTRPAGVDGTSPTRRAPIRT